MAKFPAGDAEEQPLFLSSLPPNSTHKRLAFAVVLALLAAFFITAGFVSSIQLPRVAAFVPAYATAMFLCDSISALLLFAQFAIVRSRALLVIANGYLFTALILIPWMLTFPGIFSPGGLLGAGLQTTTYLYILWHTGFPLFVIAYGLLNDPDPSRQLDQDSRRPAILSGIAVIAGVCAATSIVIASDTLLPVLMLNAVQPSHLVGIYLRVTGMFSVVALIVLWVRRRSVLDLWLMVVMCAYMIEIFLISFPLPTRFSVGWYAGRIYGLLSSSLVLIVLLYEITVLYAQLRHAVIAKRSEREARLVTGDAVTAMIAHELKQPLFGITTRAAAGARWLDRAEPDLDKAKAAFDQIAADGHRAGAVIDSTRGIFRKDLRSSTSIDINRLVADALAVLDVELQRHRVSIRAESKTSLPAVLGDPMQLRQVLVNLMTNAIDSMAITSGPRVLSVGCDVRDDGVLVSVEDTGTGIRPEDMEQVFNPLFTTKPDGMGMGLTICRSIIEAHHGRLWVVPNSPRGAVFQFVLPADKVTPAR
ncbi:MAG TPA: MASE4 domain-containing protein [Bradyrhizobium sp.]|nr:MASE4 domain-containing protein [Bradyrhizobium sp.]